MKMKQVTVLVGTGSIGQAIIRRVSAGRHIVLADYSIENANLAKETLEKFFQTCIVKVTVWLSAIPAELP
jgi:saccharopine dehydrogenase-like NADP-dependent oxidoreductase